MFDINDPYPSPAIIGRNCEMTSPNIRKPEKDRTFLIFIVVCFKKGDCQGKLCRQKTITWCIKKLTARQFVQKTSLKKLLAVLFFNPVLILRGRLSAALPRCQFVSFVFYLFSAFQAACAYGSRHRHNIWQSHPCEPP